MTRRGAQFRRIAGIKTRDGETRQTSESWPLLKRCSGCHSVGPGANARQVVSVYDKGASERRRRSEIIASWKHTRTDES